jgi:hypothetical protein
VDSNPPTMADYAWNAALDAQNANSTLQQQLTRIEAALTEIHKRLAALEAQSRG